MKSDPASGALIGYFVMVVAIVVGVTVFTFIDVQISLARIDPNDSMTWPNMAPQIRYYFIPVFSAPIAVGAIVVNLVFQLVSRRRIVRLTHWVRLGAAFSLVFFVLPLARTGVEGPVALGLSLVAAMSAVLWVWWRYGVPRV